MTVGLDLLLAMANGNQDFQLPLEKVSHMTSRYSVYKLVHFS
jgi:hypothetical protein